MDKHTELVNKLLQSVNYKGMSADEPRTNETTLEDSKNEQEKPKDFNGKNASGSTIDKCLPMIRDKRFPYLFPWNREAKFIQMENKLSEISNILNETVYGNLNIIDILEKIKIDPNTFCIEDFAKISDKIKKISGLFNTLKKYRNEFENLKNILERPNEQVRLDCRDALEKNKLKSDITYQYIIDQYQSKGLQKATEKFGNECQKNSEKENLSTENTNLMNENTKLKEEIREIENLKEENKKLSEELTQTKLKLKESSYSM